MRNFLVLLVLLATSLSARASIVITPNVSVIENDTTAFVTVDIQGRSDAGDQSIGFYGFRIALPGTATSIVANFNGQQDPWISLGLNFGDQSAVVTGMNATYTVGPSAGFGLGAIPTGRTITGTNSQIGRITFQVARTDVEQMFTLSAVASAAPLPLGASVVGGSEGFFFDDRRGGVGGPITGQIENIALATSGGGFTVSAITAVPEPTSLMLLGFAGSALIGSQLRRRRSRTAPKDAALSDE